MIEHKNTILAVVLSLLVVIGWQYFIGYPQMQRQQEEAKLKLQEQSQVQPGTQPSQTPSTTPQPGAAPPQAPGVPNTASPQAQTASRDAAIKATPRIAISTPRLGGSIDLKGGRIDDLTLTQYREAIDPDSPPIVLFSPSGAPDAYYAEFGWVPASGTTAALPGPDTVWKETSSGPLGVDRPVTLSYDNGEGLVFTRRIAL